MADAARSARGAFSDIKAGSGEMGRAVGGSMTEARHGVMLLGEEFGIHLPRGLTTFIAGLGPVGAAMQAAFPFLAIAVGATLLLEHLSKMHEAGEKLTEDQSHFALAVQNAFNALDQKLLQAGIRADELNGNHLAALKKQLELIDHQSMDDLVKTFGIVAARADVVFADLKSHWYTFGIGADGAKHALTQFKSEYDALLAKGKDKEASDLLSGTRQSAQHILDMMNQAKASQTTPGKGDTGENYAKYVAASNELKKAGVGTTEKEVQAQQALVEALNSQVTVEGKVAQLKALQGQNAAHATDNKIGAEQDKTDRANAAEQAKELEEAERLREAAYQKALHAIQESEREKIDATRGGSAERLAAIGAAIQEENNWGLQETGFYRSLMTQRVQVTREMTEEQNKLTAEAGKEEAEHTLKMGELVIQAEKTSLAIRMSLHRMSAAQILAEEIKIKNEDYQAKMQAFAAEIAALDKHGKEYENKLKALQDKELQERRKHENEISQILQTEEARRINVVQNAENKMAESIASTAAKSIMSGQNMGQAFEKLGASMLESALKHLLMMETVQGRKRFGDAKTAASDAFAWAGNPILGAIMAAVAFTAVMAFAGGTDSVPGVGSGDTVPAMLTPGEGVVPGGVMDGLRNMARNGGFAGGGDTYHLHVRPTYNVQTIDGNGMQDALNKHTGVLQKHMENTIRRMNRG